MPDTFNVILINVNQSVFSIRTVLSNDSLFFNARDIADAVGYSRVSSIVNLIKNLPAESHCLFRNFTFLSMHGVSLWLASSKKSNAPIVLQQIVSAINKGGNNIDQ